MADVADLTIGAGWPGLPFFTPSFAAHTVDATNDGVAFVFQARTADAITHLGFRYGARTGTPPTFIIALESAVASTGAPDGTVLGGGTPASATFTPPADATWDGTWQWVALANSYAPTRGQLLCLTIRYSSGTIDASNLSTFTTDLTNIAEGDNTTLPYATRLTAGSWAKRTAPPCFGVRTASTRYGQIVQSYYNTRSASTVGHRRAMKFQLPSGITTSYTLRGFRLCGSIAGATGKNPVAGLWSAGGVVQNVTLDSDVSGDAASDSYDGRHVYFDESSLTSLTPGTDYYVGLEVADAVNGGVLLNGIQFASADDRLSLSLGTSCCLSSYDGSSWTDDATVRPLLELILEDMTASGGGGGGGHVIGGGAA